MTSSVGGAVGKVNVAEVGVVLVLAVGGLPFPVHRTGEVGGEDTEMGKGGGGETTFLARGRVCAGEAGRCDAAVVVGGCTSLPSLVALPSLPLRFRPNSETRFFILGCRGGEDGAAGDMVAVGSGCELLAI